MKLLPAAHFYNSFVNLVNRKFYKMAFKTMCLFLILIVAVYGTPLYLQGYGSVSAPAPNQSGYGPGQNGPGGYGPGQGVQAGYAPGQAAPGGSYGNAQHSGGYKEYGY